jgi:nucleotide-binding universal stress UspA family protein
MFKTIETTAYVPSDADLIVVGSRGMTGARRLLGSVPDNVAHHAPCTVMIVHTD